MRDWWLRTLLVLQRPRPVFVALRDDSKQSLGDRSEPVLAIVLLAGIAGVLSTATAGRLLDDSDYDALLVAVWAFFAGSIYGMFGYFAVGALLYGGGKALGSQGTYRRARHVLAFAAVPIALSLVLWPVKLAVFGEDVFPQRRQRLGRRRRCLRRLDARVRRLGGRAARDRRARRARLDVAARAAARAALARRRADRARRSLSGRSDVARPRTARAPRRRSPYVCCSSGNAPVRTSSAYCDTASPISLAMSA